MPETVQETDEEVRKVRADERWTPAACKLNGLIGTLWQWQFLAFVGSNCQVLRVIGAFIERGQFKDKAESRP